MAKLYAELTSDKGGRVASKSSDVCLYLELREKNKHVATIEYIGGDTIRIYKEPTLTDESIDIQLT